MVVHKTYRIVRKLGKGGMGIVYLADQTFMEEQRALKFLSAELCEDVAFTGRFRQEVRALRQVRHKNVVDCGDLEPAEDDSLFFAMEFVDGPDLRDFLAKAPRPFDVPLALEITRGIAAGLGAAHAQGLVHRDIKPENILMAPVGDGWVPKIADFGIVASKESSNTRTRTGGTLLTMAYAAPEQWQGTRAAELDGRTDLYALGGVLYEMLTGRTAFEAESYEGWANQHKNTAPQAPGELRPELKQWRGLDELILRLLSKDRQSRPENVTTLLSFLDRLRHLAPQVRQETAKEKTVIALRHATAIDEGGPRGRQQEVKHEFASTTMVGEQQDARAMIPEGRPYRSRLGPLGRWVGMATITISAIAFVTVWLIRVVPWEPKTSHENAALNLPAGNPQAAQPKNQGAILKPSGGSGIPHDAKPQPAEGPKPSHEEPAVVLPTKPEPVEPAKPSTPVPSTTVPDKPSVAVARPAELRAQGETLVSQQHWPEAAPLFDRACTAGDAVSCSDLGHLYQFGGIPRDWSKALALYSKACDGNATAGCGDLGYMYEVGYGVTRDYPRAVQFYSKGCDGGSSNSCDRLGIMYWNKKGVSQDYSRALALFTKACNGGLGVGCSRAGYFYLKGVGVAPDAVKAKEMFDKGCMIGDESSCRMR